MTDIPLRDQIREIVYEALVGEDEDPDAWMHAGTAVSALLREFEISPRPGKEPEA